MGRKKTSTEKLLTTNVGASSAGTSSKSPVKRASVPSTPRGPNMAAGVSNIPLPPLLDRIGDVRHDLQEIIAGQVEDGEIPDRNVHGMSRSRSRSPLPKTAKIHNSPVRRAPRGEQDGRRGRNRHRSSSSEDSSSSSESDTESSSSEERRRKRRKKAKSSKKKSKSKHRSKSKKSKKTKRSRSRRGKKRERSSSSSSESDSSSDEEPPPPRRRKPSVGKGKVGKSGSKGKHAGRRERTPSPVRPIPPDLISDSEEEDDDDDDTSEEEWSYDGANDYDDDELDRLTARALAEVSRRANQKKPDKSKSARSSSTPAREKTDDKTKSARTDDKSKSANGATAGVTTTPTPSPDDPMERALRVMTEAFEVASERGEPINDAYARIVDGALRSVIMLP